MSLKYALNFSIKLFVLSAFFLVSKSAISLTNPDSLEDDEKKLNILVINNYKKGKASKPYIRKTKNFFKHYGSVAVVPHDKFIYYINKLSKYDLLILSGGSGNFYDIARYSLEHSALRNTTKPIIGICQGLQILTRIYSNAYHYEMKSSREHWEIFEYKNLIGYLSYSHAWAIRTRDITRTFTVLSSMNVEMSDNKVENIALSIEHINKKVFAFQGHPEDSGDFGFELINAILLKWGMIDISVEPFIEQAICNENLSMLSHL